MSLFNPGNIPVAAASFAAIEKNAKILDINSYSRADAFASKIKTPYDEVIIWVRPSLRAYSAVWRKAAGMLLVDSADSIGDDVDIDHVFPKSWTKLPCYKIEYVRIFPVWREINRSAGGGRERLDPKAPGYVPNELETGIYFASDLQLRKILGHPVGSTKDRSDVFQRR
jgi:hypothetical protein